MVIMISYIAVCDKETMVRMAIFAIIVDDDAWDGLTEDSNEQLWNSLAFYLQKRFLLENVSICKHNFKVSL